jgi:hypothetical protein
MCSARRYHRSAVVGFPIRTSPDHRLYTATRGFSQCPTSFFGTWRLGILRKPLLAFSPSCGEFVTSCAFSLLLLLHYSVGKVLLSVLRQDGPANRRAVTQHDLPYAQSSLAKHKSTSRGSLALPQKTVTKALTLATEE